MAETAAVVIGLLVFLAVRSALQGDPVARRLKTLQTLGQKAPSKAKGRADGAGAIEGIGERLLDVRFLKPLRTRLVQADLRLHPGEAIVAALVVDAVLTIALTALLGPLGIVLGTAATAIGGHLLLGALAGHRRRRIEEALPDYLQSVANGLRAGHALTTALEGAITPDGGPLDVEMVKTTKETRLGIPLEAALGDLMERCGVMEVDMAVTAILVQRQVGGNLAEVLDRIQATLRERVRIAGEVRALTAQGRLSGMVVGLMPVGLALLMWVMDPAFIAPLTSTAIGHILILLAVGLEGLGAYAISRVVKVDF